ncbi:helix-turn-helix transcriptional regulator [Enterococcus faecalis]|nr:helix-turn-helix transcriptional regulator [Enterococcus faecalis]EGO8163074.1 helix-turn-helix transcriptional regulator [Enterococcus faecalis]
MSKIGKLIRKIRNNRGLTQREVAQSIGVTDSCVRNYELGYRNPDNQKRIDIAGALGVSEYYLIEPSYPYSKEDILRFLFKLDDTTEVKLIQLSDKNYAITFDDRTNEELLPLLEQWQEEKLEEMKYGRRIN